MRPKTLKNNLLFAFLIVIFILGAFTAILGFYLIQEEIVARVQKEVIGKGKAAELLYEGEIGSIAQSLQLTATIEDLDVVKKVSKLDYVYEITAQDPVPNDIVRRAFAGAGAGGTRIIPEDDLKKVFPQYYKAFITPIQYTPKARPGFQTDPDRTMVRSVDCIHYKGIFQPRQRIFIDKKIIYSPADITLARSAFQIPPGIMTGAGFEMPETINHTGTYNLID